MARITDKEALELFDLPLGDLAKMAHDIKLLKHGRNVSFIKTYYINFTNICLYACKYCGFRRNKRQSDAYVLNHDQVRKKLENSPELVSEVWFSSGLNKDLPYEYYLELLRTIKSALKPSLT